MTPWKDLLVKIKKIEKKYGSSLKKRASPTEIIKMNQGIQLNFGNMVLPDSYERFLKTINGLNFNELVIYGVDKGLLDNELNEDMHGFIESNELWYENEWQKQYRIQVPVTTRSTSKDYRQNTGSDRRYLLVGGPDRLPTDDGGHLIASIFKGSGDIDNLVPMNANINRGEY